MAENEFSSLVKKIENGWEARWYPDGYLDFAKSVVALWDYVDPAQPGELLSDQVLDDHTNFTRAVEALTNVKVWTQTGKLRKPSKDAQKEIQDLLDSLKTATTMEERRPLTASLVSVFAHDHLQIDLVTRQRVRNLGLTPDARVLFERQVENMNGMVKNSDEPPSYDAFQFKFVLLTSYLLANGQFLARSDRVRIRKIKMAHIQAVLSEGSMSVSDVVQNQPIPSLAVFSVQGAAHLTDRFIGRLPKFARLPTARALNRFAHEGSWFNESVGGPIRKKLGR